MSNSLLILYIPHPSMPSHCGANFVVRGHGAVYLEPAPFPNEKPVRIVSLLLEQCGDRVSLVNPDDMALVEKERKKVARKLADNAKRFAVEATPVAVEVVPEPAPTESKKSSKGGEV